MKDHIHNHGSNAVYGLGLIGAVVIIIELF